MKKVIYIIGGPNGAGKTTFVEEYLPKFSGTLNFINADNIARGLSPFDYKSVSVKAGKIMLQLMEDFQEKGISFSFETTLSGVKWKKFISDAQIMGYKVVIFFVFVNEVNLSHERIKFRVIMGGHDIPTSGLFIISGIFTKIWLMSGI